MQRDSRSRRIERVIPSVAASDGAGVKLRRSLGSSQALRLDPFLLLDEFGTENPDDYIAGFPPHPHRGFETVTYMLDGHMRHEDHMGNVGQLSPGGVQWMTAGRGVIHSEMPQQESGRMRGFQLWVNLPAAEKMQPASYRDIAASDIPEAKPADGVRVRVIAGAVQLGDRIVRGPVNAQRDKSTDPIYLDIRLAANARVELPVTSGHNALLYAFEGSASVDDSALRAQAATVLSDGDHVAIRAGDDGAAVLLIAGRAIREPVAQYGPFVMNTREEIEQALDDYRRDALT